MNRGIVGHCFSLETTTQSGVTVLRRAFLLATAVLAVAGCTAKAPDTAADEAQLRVEAPKWFDLWNKGDSNGVANLYAEDAIILYPGVPAVVGNAAIKTYFANDIAAARAAGITNTAGEITGVGVSGDLAWVSGTFAVKDASGQTLDEGKYLSVYRRVNSEWKLIRDTWNSDKAAPPPAAPPAT